MDILTSFLNGLYYGLIAPFFQFCARAMTLLFIRPMTLLHLPEWLQVGIIAVLVALFAFWMRALLRVDERIEEFNRRFAEKRRQQQELRLIPDKYSRDALYRTTDEELNEEYNTFIAYHYARYVMIYMLPLFLVLAWLNSVFSESWLVARHGQPFLVPLPANSFGVSGLSVTFVFLLIYILTLIVGFQLRRHRKKR
ncbi:MAG TPA: hypothetical protein ENI89_05095 [Desulfobulbus sp.]|nr:hypothetical protein [Desulfobulbus sp.]